MTDFVPINYSLVFAIVSCFGGATLLPQRADKYLNSGRGHIKGVCVGSRLGRIAGGGKRVDAPEGVASAEGIEPLRPLGLAGGRRHGARRHGCSASLEPHGCWSVEEAEEEEGHM